MSISLRRESAAAASCSGSSSIWRRTASTSTGAIPERLLRELCLEQRELGNGRRGAFHAGDAEGAERAGDQEDERSDDQQRQPGRQERREAGRERRERESEREQAEDRGCHEQSHA